jgi:hypothetical protein
MENIMPKKMNNTETKRDRFVRIAERRVNKILNDLESLGKCSNKRNYEYTDADVRKIFREIDKKVKEIKALYRTSKNNSNRFRLAP